MKKLPKTLLSTTTTAQIQLLTRSRTFSFCIVRSALVARSHRGRDGFSRLLVGHEPFAFGPQRQVFARLLREAAPLAGIEHCLAHDTPDHARAEEIFAVEPLHPLHQLSAI